MRFTIIAVLVILLVTFGVVTFRQAGLPPVWHPRLAPVPPEALQKTGPPIVKPARQRPVPLRREVKPLEPIDISGPLKGRGIARMCIPPYPDWAEEAGVTDVVSVRIWAHPDGQVSSFMETVRAGFYPELEELVRNALKEWRFVPMSNATGKQWGIVTFRYLLVPAEEGPVWASLRSPAAVCPAPFRSAWQASF